MENDTSQERIALLANWEKTASTYLLQREVECSCGLPCAKSVNIVVRSRSFSECLSAAIACFECDLVLRKYIPIVEIENAKIDIIKEFIDNIVDNWNKEVNKVEKSIKIQTEDLVGAQLDYAVGKANGIDVEIRAGMCCYKGLNAAYDPSTNWLLGGPIIEREHIMLEPSGENGAWCAQIWMPELIGWWHIEGKTPLIAAMRIFVRSKFGDEVEVPE